MKRPQHMTMRELIALPVLAQLDDMPAFTSLAPGDHGGVFTDEHGHLWRTLRGDDGWARYPAHLALLAAARQPARRAPTRSAIAARTTVPLRPRHSMLGAVLRAFG